MRFALALALFALPLAAQVTPHAGYLYPAGGRQGVTIEVRMGGQYLTGARQAYVSGRGVEAKVIEYHRAVNGKERQFMAEEMRKLNEKRSASYRKPKPGEPKVVFTEADQKRWDEIRDAMEEWARQRYIPSIAEIVRLQVTIAPDAPLGPREVRIEGNAGLTNPVVFVVGELPEYAQPATRVGPLFAVINGGTPIIRSYAKQPPPPMEIKIPAVVNGQMMPAAVDQYRFHATKGQDIVVAADARELIPYLGDAVPGWFQAFIALRDPHGRELASADHFFFHPDPMLHYVIPEDGDYIAEIHDSIFRGREDFVYRMTIGELPVITSIFPLGAKTGARPTIEAHGWNLPAPKVKENFKGKPAGVYPVSLKGDQWDSNAVDFVLDPLPEKTAKAGIGQRAKAQKVKLPVILDGRIAHPGEVAFFRFDARAGQEIVAEVKARRLGSPLDSELRLTDAKGKELAFNDDHEDKGAALLTHQADSFIQFKLPAKGTYYLRLADTQHNGGTEYGYRLRISQPRPDFELRVEPSSFNPRSGQTVPFSVFALRRDGFSGPIALKLKNAPAGFQLSGAAVPAGQDQVRLTVTLPRMSANLPLSIELIGQATVNGHEVTRTAVAAQDMEQAFAYHHIVPEDAWMVRVIGSGGGMPWRQVNKPVELRAGAPTPLEMYIPGRLQNVQLALSDPPEGLSIQKVTPERNGLSMVLHVDPDKLKPGASGNLIVDAFRNIPANPKAGVKKPRRQPLGTMPAIPFEVVR